MIDSFRIEAGCVRQLQPAFKHYKGMLRMVLWLIVGLSYFGAACATTSVEMIPIWCLWDARKKNPAKVHVMILVGICFMYIVLVGASFIMYRRMRRRVVSVDTLALIIGTMLAIVLSHLLLTIK